MSNFLNTYFNPCHPVKQDQIILGCGLMTMLGQIGGAVANRGDGVLITAPYFSGFDLSFTMVYGVRMIPAMMGEKDVGTMNELAILEKTIHDSSASGVTVKAILLCNPHNPLGRCYPKQVIEGYCRLCERYNLHLLSDENFAMSVFPTRDSPQPPSFISILSIDPDKIGVNPARIHVLYGMSKDFNANGFRAGALVSQSNSSLIRALTMTNAFSIIASPTAALWTAILNDAKYLERFISTNRAKLSEAYDYMASWLSVHGLPYIPSHAAHFMMVDVRLIVSDIERYGSLLGIKASDTIEEREIALVKYIDSKGVVLSPGSSYHMEGGWIRLLFSVRRDHLTVALRRIEEALMWKM
jgi:aspartate/methionine/tyrosine aminotransferase